MLAENWDKARKRNTAAIHGFVGPNGSGKTGALVHDAMTAMLDGRPQLSTVALLDWTARCENCGATPCTPTCNQSARPPHPLWVPFVSLEQLLDWRDGDVNMDEVQGVASAREHQGMPYQVANYLRKMRHYDARLRWSAPDWMAADAVIRRVSRAVTVCEGKLPKQHIDACPACSGRHVKPTRHCDLHGRSRLWDDNRLLTWKTYDATKFEEFNVNRVADTAAKRIKLRTHVRQSYWRPGNLVERAYDTYGEVISLGAADMAGVCIACGGVKKRKPCRCPDQDDDGAPAPISLREFRRSGALDDVLSDDDSGHTARSAGPGLSRTPRHASPAGRP